MAHSSGIPNRAASVEQPAESGSAPPAHVPWHRLSADGAGWLTLAGAYFLVPFLAEREGHGWLARSSGLLFWAIVLAVGALGPVVGRGIRPRLRLWVVAAVWCGAFGVL